MKNYLNIYSILWIVTIILYSFSWSELCEPLDSFLLIFIIFIIVFDFILGKKFKKLFDYCKNTEEPKTYKLFYVQVILYCLNIIYKGYIPIISIFGGNSYNMNNAGLPLINSILPATLIVYSFYLSSLYWSFKNKKILLKILTIILLFFISLSRQNMFICITMFVVEYLASKGIKNIIKSKLTVLLIVLSMSFAVIGFGIIGNMRYGKWKWNDSSMIMSVGKINDNYPKILPKTAFWAYTYEVSPLVNLNYNIRHYGVHYNFKNYILEYVPDYIRTKTNLYTPTYHLLPVSALTVGTEFMIPYINGGFLGIFCMFIIKTLLCIIISIICKKNNPEKLNIINSCLLYFYIFSFFDNTFSYTITSIVLVITICIVYENKVKKIICLLKKNNNKNLQ